MAHKKGVGSSKNGRESASKRLGVKISVVRFVRLATSSYVREVQFIIPVRTWVWVQTTHSTHSLTVPYSSRRDVTTRVSFLSSPLKHNICKKA